MKLSPELDVYPWQGVMDMRRSFDLLVQFVKEQLKVPATSGAVYVFFSRCRSKVKLLYWDRDGYAIWHRHLEAGEYRIETTEGTQKISV
jgi:transposase